MLKQTSFCGTGRHPYHGLSNFSTLLIEPNLCFSIRNQHNITVSLVNSSLLQGEKILYLLAQYKPFLKM